MEVVYPWLFLLREKGERNASSSKSFPESFATALKARVTHSVLFPIPSWFILTNLSAPSSSCRGAVTVPRHSCTAWPSCSCASTFPAPAPPSPVCHACISTDHPKPFNRRKKGFNCTWPCSVRISLTFSCSEGEPHQHGLPSEAPAAPARVPEQPRLPHALVFNPVTTEAGPR